MAQRKRMPWLRLKVDDTAAMDDRVGASAARDRPFRQTRTGAIWRQLARIKLTPTATARPTIFESDVDQPGETPAFSGEG